MDILIITVLIIAAVILFLVELFVIPGISLAGISALVCIIYANYYAFANLGMAAGFITLGISGVACIGSLVWFMRSKMLDKLALKKDIDSKVDRYQYHPPGTNRLCRNQRKHRGGEVDRWLPQRKDADYRKPYHRRYNYG